MRAFGIIGGGAALAALAPLGVLGTLSYALPAASLAVVGKSLDNTFVVTLLV